MVRLPQTAKRSPRPTGKNAIVYCNRIVLFLFRRHRCSPVLKAKSLKHNGVRHSFQNDGRRCPYALFVYRICRGAVASTRLIAKVDTTALFWSSTQRSMDDMFLYVVVEEKFIRVRP